MKPVIIGQARTGLPTASAGDVRIHSAYDPEKEAARFVEGLNLKLRAGATIVVLGGGLGYLERALGTIYPESRVISFVLDKVLYDARTGPTQTCWYPGVAESPGEFLTENIMEYEIPGLRIIEWPASFNARPKLGKAIRGDITALVRLYSGNISATAAFGRHWIRNCLRNFLELDNTCLPVAGSDPVVIAASGPSLEEALPFLRKYRDRYRLWALPSSVRALENAHLIPDIIFATDPGHWARLHTRYFPASVPVARPLSAAPLPPHSGPGILIPQGSCGEERLIGEGNWDTLNVPETGTVAATALEAWKRLSDGPLLLVGLDLAWTDLRSHARPHAFDEWIDSVTRRTAPALDVAWQRAGNQVPDRDGILRTGAALKTYADWFAGNCPAGRAVRLRLATSTCRTVIPGLEDADESWFEDLGSLSETPFAMQIRKSPLSRAEREQSVRILLESWILKVTRSEIDSEKARLMYTLDPGGVLEAGRLNGSEKEAALQRHRERVMKILNSLARHYE